MHEITIFIIILALAFDFVNGFHDAANAIATIVATRVLTPLQAVTMSAIGNFVGMIFGTVVGVLIAKTIGKGIIDTGLISGWLGVYLIFAVLVGAITWDLITWYFGLPTSSSHALVGGLVGAGLALGGIGAILGPDIHILEMFFLYALIGGMIGIIFWILIDFAIDRKISKKSALIGFVVGAVIVGSIVGWYYKKKLLGLTVTIIFMVFSPLIGLGVAFLFTAFIMRAFRKVIARKINRYFRKLQLVSSFFYSVMHGTSDAQKVMGIITILLVFDGVISTFEVPLWVVVACHASIALGTFFGGWRIVKTMAHRITNLQPYQGFCAETGGGFVLMMNAIFGIPVSSTHIISSSIMGVGATRRLSAVRWGVARRVIWAWILTIPMAAVISFIVMKIIIISRII